MIVRQADNVLRCLEYFASEQAPATLSVLSDRLDLPISSTSNLIETLRNRGYLYEVRQRGGFYPTRRLRDLGEAIDAGDPVLGLVRETMVDLCRQTGETILLGARNASEIVYIEVVESPKPIRYAARIGDRKPIYAVSGGKAILGLLPEADIEPQIARLDFSAAAPTSITDPAKLLGVLTEGRRRGWHLNATEFTPEVSGVGVGLQVAGRTLGLSVAGPNYRMDGRHEELAACLMDHAAELRGRLGEGPG